MSENPTIERISELDFLETIYEFEDELAQNRLNHITFSSITAMQTDETLNPGDTAIVNGAIYDTHEVTEVKDETDMTDPDVIYLYNDTYYKGDSGEEAIGFVSENGFIVVSDKNTFVTPEMFGAVADGITDDTQAIQDCIDASSGKIIVFPDGIYLIRQQLKMVDNYACLMLSTNAEIKAASAMTNMLYLSRSAEQNKQFIKGGIWNGNGLADNCIYTNYVANLTIEDCVIKNAVLVNLNLYNGYEILARNIRIDNEQSYTTNPSVVGLNLDATDSTLKNIIVKNNTKGFTLKEQCTCEGIHPWCNDTVRMPYTIGVEIGANVVIMNSEIDTMAKGITTTGYWQPKIYGTYFIFNHDFDNEGYTPIYLSYTQGYITCNECFFGNPLGSNNLILTDLLTHSRFIDCRFPDTFHSTNAALVEFPEYRKNYRLIVATGSDNAVIPANGSLARVFNIADVVEGDFITWNTMYMTNASVQVSVIPQNGNIRVILRNYTDSDITILYANINVTVHKNLNGIPAFTTVNHT